MSGMPRIIDSHVHIWPDGLVQKNLELISRLSGITPAYSGSVSSLHTCMVNCQTSQSCVNNLVQKPELLRKANDWTANAVAEEKDKLVGVGFLVAGARESVGEAQRCASELGFKGFKMHHSHMRVLPGDERNWSIYEKISELGLPVLFHCGRNPFSKDGMQFAVPKNFETVLSSFDKMKVILGHLAGYEDDPEDAAMVLGNHKNVFADTAVDFSKITRQENLREFIQSAGTERFVFGSDFPILDPLIAKDWLCKNLSPKQFLTVVEENPRKLFSLS